MGVFEDVLDIRSREFALAVIPSAYGRLPDLADRSNFRLGGAQPVLAYMPKVSHSPKSYCIKNILARILFRTEFACHVEVGYGAIVKPSSRIKNLRLSLGLKQIEFAERLETSQSEISKIEGGKVPTRDQLVALSKLSGKPIDYFLGDDLPPTEEDETPPRRPELTADEVEKAARRVFDVVRQAWHSRDFSEAEIVDLYSRCRRLISDL